MIEVVKVGFLEKEIAAIVERNALIKVTMVAVCSSDLHSVKMGDIPLNNFLGNEAIGE